MRATITRGADSFSHEGTDRVVVELGGVRIEIDPAHLELKVHPGLDLIFDQSGRGDGSWPSATVIRWPDHAANALAGGRK